MIHLALLLALQDDWLPIDPRSKGTGNAGVALAEGASSGYWNPARLGLPPDEGEFELLGSGFGLQASGFIDTAVEGEALERIDALADLYAGLDFQGIQSRFNAGTSTNQDLQDAMRVIDSVLALGEDGIGVTGALGGGIDLRLGAFGLYARQSSQAGIDPFFDFSIPNASSFTSAALATFFGTFTVTGPLTPAASNLSTQLQNAGLVGDTDGDGNLDADEVAFHAQQALGDAAISDPVLVSALQSIAQATNAIGGTGSTSQTLFFNGSGVEVHGITIREVGVSFGYPVLPFLSVGVTLKEMIGETFRLRITAAQVESGADVLDELLRNFHENTKRTNRFSADLGVSVTPLPFLTIGLTAKNVIPVEFDYADGSTALEIEPQLRLGIAVSPFDIVKIGLDVDVLENDLDDLVSGLKSRVLGGGVEVDLEILKIRGGIFDNLASAKSSPVWTLGLGLNVAGFFLDLNGQIAWSRVDIETGTSVDRVPERLSGSIALGFDLKF